MVTKASSAHRPPAARSPFFVTRLVGRLFSIIFLLVLALVVSIVIEWIGILFWWPEEDVGHSAAMVETEMRYLALVARDNPFITSPDALILQQRESVLELARAMQLHQVAAVPFAAAEVAVRSAVNIAQVFVLRLTVMGLSLPVFIVFGLVGLVRGLVARDLRRWGGGRESSGMYHLYMRAMPQTALGLWFVYLAMPISINPLWIVAPAAIFFAWLVGRTAYRFKKYI